MFDKNEDSRTEFKEIINEKLEKEIIAFLNNNGGNLYLGIKDNGEIVGVDNDIDKLQLEIKDRIKNNICPNSLGLFDINVETYNNKKVINISVAGGIERPYYLKRKGMTPEGCFVRVSNSTEHMKQEEINKIFAKRTRNSLRNIVSPNQNLTFRQLKIYYEEKGFPINENFFKQLNLITDDGKYNYIAYLLSDNNNISIKVATYSGNDAYDLSENEEYGYCSLIKATNKVIDKFDVINKTFSKITSSQRKEIKMFDPVAIREAVVNAIVHNAWETENPPKFEIFDDHISITSTGGLPDGVNEDEFLRGYSFPKHPELMRVFKDLDLVEQLGTGIIRILKTYEKDVYVFTDNFIRINFYFNNSNQIYNNGPINGPINRPINGPINGPVNNKNNSEKNELTYIQQEIVKLMRENSTITQKELETILDIGHATLLRHKKILIDKQYIVRIGSRKNGYWKVLK